MPMYSRTTYLPTPTHLPTYQRGIAFAYMPVAAGLNPNLRFFQFVLGIEIIMRKGRK